ncbi:hypothetical protein BGZ52_003231 [Haplosporangium bisporale]|nr:hypothetical protein BGZ52_003231 [Haplosporangium bisporale]
MGTAAATQSGPSVTVSFLLGGFVSGIAALSYSEMASMIPIAGSAYTYAYASIGELAAWIIGWDLILEYLVGAATVSVGWSSYMTSFMKDAFNVELSTKWTNTPVVWIADDFKSSGDYFNAPAFFISVVISTTIYFGIHTTAKINNYLVAFKVLVLIIIIFSMIPFIKTSNYKPYIPNEEGFGVSGMLQGASTVFFAYIGFDSVSTTAQEAKEPQVNLPVGIIATILISTILYVGISVVTVGVAPYRDLGGRSPMVDAVRLTNMTWLVVLTELGALAATTSVILVLLIAQPRVFYSMANDGLIPRVFAKVHPVHKTPYVSTIVTGVLCSIFGGLLPINVLSDISSVGTIFAYFVVNIGVIILRYTRKTAPRRFKVPGEINNPRLIIDEPMRVLHEGYSVDDSGSYHGYTDDDLQEQYARQIARRNQYDRPRSGYYGSRRASRYTDQEMVMTTPNNGVNIIEGCQAPVQPNGGDNNCASPFETRANTSSTAVDSGVGIGSGIPSRHSSLSHADAFKKRHEFAQKQQDQREKQQQQHRPLQPLLQIHLQQHETMGLSDQGSGQSNPKDPSSSSSTSSAMSYRLEQYPETAHLSSR